MSDCFFFWFEDVHPLRYIINEVRSKKSSLEWVILMGKAKKVKKSKKQPQKPNITITGYQIEKPVEKKKLGRPRKYDRAKIQAALCAKVAHSNKSLFTCLQEVKKDLGEAPDLSIIFDWLHADKAFAEAYARAKEEQADFLVEEMLAIADDDSADAIFVEVDDKSGKSAKMVCNNEFIQRSRLKVDTRKWIASKLKPKKYGDKIELEASNDGHPLIMLCDQASISIPEPATTCPLAPDHPKVKEITKTLDEMREIVNGK